jgi:hypothetical protein
VPDREGFFLLVTGVMMRARKRDAVERNRTILLALGAIAVVGIVLWSVAEWHRMGSTLGLKDQIQMQVQFLGAVAQILTVGALLAGLYFTWKNVHVLHEGQITERFTRSIEHLGSDKLQVRIGGLYALGRIARDSRADQPFISCVLCTYVRENARWDENCAPHPPAYDIQAALTILGSQTWAREPTRPWFDLSGTDLRGVDLCWAHLDDANFTGSHLEGARLVEAHMERAYFTNAHLQGANLTGANLSGAKLTGANLDKADLDGVIGLTEEQIQSARVTPPTSLTYLPNHRPSV